MTGFGVGGNFSSIMQPATGPLHQMFALCNKNLLSRAQQPHNTLSNLELFMRSSAVFASHDICCESRSSGVSFFSTCDQVTQSIVNKDILGLGGEIGRGRERKRGRERGRGRGRGRKGGREREREGEGKRGRGKGRGRKQS